MLMPCFSNFHRRCATFVVLFLACVEHHYGTVRAFSVPSSSSPSSSSSSSSITKEVVYSSNSNNKCNNSSNKNQNNLPSTRRDFGASAVAASLAAAGSGGAASWCLAPTPVHAAETAGASSSSSDLLIPYEDTRYKFKLMIPSSWETTPEQALPDRRKINLWFAPNSEQQTLLFIAYTPTRGDFTSLGSFGVRTYFKILLVTRDWMHNRVLGSLYNVLFPNGHLSSPIFSVFFVFCVFLLLFLL